MARLVSIGPAVQDDLEPVELHKGQMADEPAIVVSSLGTRLHQACS
ncbi:hypothetical protein HNR02_006230 [Amycolatopsis endophytica]|uniref:Uncharacterized protein n=1 Tax=Amycolatopsis endophytica TaxID=860233 RepID=A0A853BDL6_9PSEU|nr:hypothetical protein [Amycolatopsis endophytica]